MRSPTGVGLVEVLGVLAILAIAVTVVLPLALRARRGASTAAAARHVVVGLHALRWKSVASGVGHGWWFRRDGRGWSWVEVVDGNGNGLRTAELREGTDRTVGGPHRLEDRMPPATFGFPPGAPIPAIPPRRGAIEGHDRPIRVGASNLLAFGASGAASSGTLYVTDGRELLYGVVLFGATGRVRVWRFDRGTGSWRQ